MKYTMAQLMKKIRGSEGKIEDAKLALWQIGRVLKKKKALTASILGGLALATGATLGFLFLKKNGSHQKKKLEGTHTKELAHRRRPFSRLLNAVAFISTVSTIIGTLSRTGKR